MRWVCILLLLSVRSALAFDASCWPLSAHPEVRVYTNALANDLTSNTLFRVRSTGDTNWNHINSMSGTQRFTNDYVTTAFTNGTDIVPRTFTNTYPVVTNIWVTNWYGAYNRDGITGAVPVLATAFEALTKKIEEVLPQFSLAYYADTSDTNDVLFDLWFRREQVIGAYPDTTTNYPDDFPYASKADAFHKAGLGGLLVYSNGVTNLTFTANLACATNAFGQVTNTAGFWTKRKNRVNPLIVGQWGPEMVLDSDGYPATCYGGWANPNGSMFQINTYPSPISTFMPRNTAANEYAESDSTIIGASRLIDLESYGGQNPTFNWIPAREGVVFPDDLSFAYNTATWGFHGIYWASNQLYDSMDLPGGSFQALSNPKQHSDKAWVSVRLPITGTVPFDINTNMTVVAGVTNYIYTTNYLASVQLVWTNEVTTYEGTKVWDVVLLREQIDEHFGMLTNMYLTPKPISGWTNGYGYVCTNEDYETWLTNYWWWPLVTVTNACTNGVTTNSVAPSPFDDAETYISISWWRGLPVMFPINGWWPTNFDIFSGLCISNASPYTNNLSDAPSYTRDTQFYIDLRERFYAEAAIIPPMTNNHSDPYPDSTIWEWYAYRTDTVSYVSSEHAVVSSPVIRNLWEGAEHRAHFYVRTDKPDAEPYFKRVSTSDWTFASTVIGSPIDLRFLLTNESSLTEGDNWGGGEFITTLNWEEVCDYIAPTDLVTYLVSYVPTNVWYTNSFTIETNTYAVGALESVGVTVPPTEGIYYETCWTFQGAPVYYAPSIYKAIWYYSGIGWLLSAGGGSGHPWFGSATGPDGVYIPAAGEASGTATVSWAATPVDFTNVVTNVVYGVSNLQFAVTNQAVTNTTTICGWHAYYVTNGDEKVFIDLWVTNYTIIETNYPPAEGSGEVLSAVHTTNVETSTSSLGCVVTNLIEIYNADEWVASNSYAVGQIPVTVWPTPPVPDCIKTPEHWKYGSIPWEEWNVYASTNDPVTPQAGGVFYTPWGGDWGGSPWIGWDTSASSGYGGYYNAMLYGTPWPIYFDVLGYKDAYYTPPGYTIWNNGTWYWVDLRSPWYWVVTLMDRAYIRGGTWTYRTLKGHYADIYTYFTLHEPCVILENVIQAHWGGENWQTGSNRWQHTITPEIRAVVEWRTP